MSSGWIRVTRANPCPICEKPDWCSVHPEIGVCCMRVQSGHQLKNEGWLHKKDEKKLIHYTPPSKPKEEVNIDAEKLMRKYWEQTKREWIVKLASELGVSAASLVLLGAAWAGDRTAWAFPMKNGLFKTIGIRLRKSDGSKFAVTGSKQGLFIPTISFRGRTAYICEGPTDTAAALTLGLAAIGRPSCLGSIEDTKLFIKLNGVKDAVIITDNDTPGITGSSKLQEALPVDTCRVILPAKDMRQFVNNGGTAVMLESIAKSVVWRKYGTRN